MIRLAVALAAFAAVICTGPVQAQTVPERGPDGTPRVAAASPMLPPGHWVHGVLMRLSGAQLLPGDVDPGTTSITRSEALVRLRQAQDKAHASDPRFVSLIGAYISRFEEEFRGTVVASAPLQGGPVAGLDGAVSIGYRSHTDRLQARHHLVAAGDDGPQPLEDVVQPLGGLALAAHLRMARWSVAAFSSMQAEPNQMDVREAYAVLLSGKAGVWAGRRSLGFGLSDGGSIVLRGAVPLDGAGFFLDDGIRLPGPLRHAGPLRFETSISRAKRSGSIEAPWFFTARLSVAPHPRVRVAVNRGALFAGRNNEAPATAGRVLKVFAGIEIVDARPRAFDNHVASLDAWVAPPLGSLPLVVYAEYGVEDLGRRVRIMPATVLGARVAAVPEAPWLGGGLEWTSFGTSARGLPWYEHRVFGSWTDGGQPRGRELGGAGEEWRAYASADLIDARLHLEARAFSRHRNEENLYGPDRAGSSRGLAATGRHRFSRRFETVAEGAHEAGSGWQESVGAVSIRLIF